MQIVRLMGGFANQIRQYVYGRYLEHCTGTKTYYDDSWFYLYKMHNGYELKRVYGLNLNLISNCFKNEFQKAINEKKTIYQVFFESGFDIELISGISENISFRGKIIKFTPKSAFSIIPSNKCRYHLTYAPDFALYYRQIKDIIDGDLIFVNSLNKTARLLAKTIETTKSAGIHFRLGDFKKVGWLANPEYYKKCIEYTENNYNPDKYFIFSDDIEYCKKNLNVYGLNSIYDKLEFVDGNRGLTDYVDFRLMSLCKYFIVAPRSSFCECACVFNKRLLKKIDWTTIGWEVNDSYGWKN